MHGFELKKRQILDRVDLFDVVSERITMRRSGRRWVGLCPFHSEKTPSFTVSPEQGVFKCFGCGKGGDVFSFVQFVENVPFVEAMRMLADRAGVTLDETPGSERSGPSRADLAKLNEWAVGFFRRAFRDEAVGGEARAYVEKRGFSPDTVERFQIGLAVPRGLNLAREAARAGFGESMLLEADLIRRGERGDVYETFRDRLMFPIRDATNRVIGFGGRTLVDDRAKYLNTRQTSLFDKGRNLYGIDVARTFIVERQRCLVVEGYTDCMACHQAGVTEAVATLGTALTDYQVGLIRRYCEEVVLLFDSDEAGEAAADRAIRVALPACLRVRLARVPDGKDPCELLILQGVNAFSDVLKRASDALEFKWLKTRQRFGEDGSSSKKREAVLDFLRVVSEGVKTSAIDEIGRGQLANQVAHVLKIDAREVLRMISPPPRSAPAGLPKVDGHLKTRGEEQAAWVHVLEVALNEPSLLREVSDLPDIARIESAMDRQIAELVLRLVAELGEPRLEDLLGAASGEVAARMFELHERGGPSDKYADKLALALLRLRRSEDAEQIETLRSRAMTKDERTIDITGDSNEARLIRDKVQEHRHFAPRRMIRSAVGGHEARGETLSNNAAKRT